MSKLKMITVTALTAATVCVGSLVAAPSASAMPRCQEYEAKALMYETLEAIADAANDYDARASSRSTRPTDTCSLTHSIGRGMPSTASLTRSERMLLTASAAARSRGLSCANGSGPQRGLRARSRCVVPCGGTARAPYRSWRALG
jgi:hypothetical protein